MNSHELCRYPIDQMQRSKWPAGLTGSLGGAQAIEESPSHRGRFAGERLDEVGIQPLGYWFLRGRRWPRRRETRQSGEQTGAWRILRLRNRNRLSSDGLAGANPDERHEPGVAGDRASQAKWIARIACTRGDMAKNDAFAKEVGRSCLRFKEHGRPGPLGPGCFKTKSQFDPMESVLGNCVVDRASCCVRFPCCGVGKRRIQIQPLVTLVNLQPEMASELLDWNGWTRPTRRAEPVADNPEQRRGIVSKSIDEGIPEGRRHRAWSACTDARPLPDASGELLSPFG
jgi:hypothetical protein